MLINGFGVGIRPGEVIDMDMIALPVSDELRVSVVAHQRISGRTGVVRSRAT